MLAIAEKVSTKYKATFSYRVLHIDTPVLAIYKTYQKQWPIGTDGKKESIKFVPPAYHDDDEIKPFNPEIKSKQFSVGRKPDPTGSALTNKTSFIYILIFSLIVDIHSAGEGRKKL